MSRHDKRMLLGAILALWAGFMFGLAACPAHAEPDTFERECQTFYGNPDGSWCTWTNPANGKKYLVGSNDFWYQGSLLGGGAHF